VLQANQGTRFIQVTFGSWTCTRIFMASKTPGQQLYTMAKPLDTASPRSLATSRRPACSTRRDRDGRRFGRTVATSLPPAPRSLPATDRRLRPVQRERRPAMHPSPRIDTVDFAGPQPLRPPEDLEARSTPPWHRLDHHAAKDTPSTAASEYVPFSRETVRPHQRTLGNAYSGGAPPGFPTATAG